MIWLHVLSEGLDFDERSRGAFKKCKHLVMPRIKAGLKVQAVPLVHGIPVISSMFGSAQCC